MRINLRAAGCTTSCCRRWLFATVHVRIVANDEMAVSCLFCSSFHDKEVRCSHRPYMSAFLLRPNPCFREPPSLLTQAQSSTCAPPQPRPSTGNFPLTLDIILIAEFLNGLKPLKNTASHLDITRIRCNFCRSIYCRSPFLPTSAPLRASTVSCGAPAHPWFLSCPTFT
jgi:hypothetical protein